MIDSFMQVSWANTASIYEVNIRQYTAEGTFKAFEKHLPRIKDMGIDMIWLMPITPISQLQKKGSLGSYYACSSYTKINPEFGIESDLKDLVDTAHSLGMKVIMDWVANHTGIQHEWMQENPNWFAQDASGNFTERNGWDDVVDLNFGNPLMRIALIDAMAYWVRQFNMDGFRCDMAHLVPLDFWVEARTKLQDSKTLYWLAECEDIAYHSIFDTSYAWSWMHASEKVGKGEDGLHEVYTILHQYAQYPKGASKLFFTSNHDENSWNGTEYEKYGIAAKAWAVFTLTWNGQPLIYSGQELPNHKRLAFFDKDQLLWTSETPLLHDFYKTLLTARKQFPVLANGTIFNLPTNNSAMAYLKQDQGQTALVILNLSAERQQVHVAHEAFTGKFTNLFSGLCFEFNGGSQFVLMPGEYIVYLKGSTK
jgi:glycosidase